MSGETSNVFVIDDDIAARESVAAMVETMGYASRQYASAESFLDAYHPDEPGCIVSDIRMSGMSGLELLEHMRAVEMSIPIILITAYANVPLAVRAMRQGAVVLLEKPYRDYELWDAVRQALEIDARDRAAWNQRRQIQRSLAQLTEAERRVVNLIVDGRPNKVIANQLDVSLRTVEARRHDIFQKLGVDSVAALVRVLLAADAMVT